MHGYIDSWIHITFSPINLNRNYTNKQLTLFDDKTVMTKNTNVIFTDNIVMQFRPPEQKP